MKQSFKHLIAATLLAAVGFAAVAQTPAAPAAGNAPARHERMERHDPAKMKEFMAKRQAALKQKLQITPAQEGAWTAWTTAMQPPANWKRPDRAEFEKLSTPERIDRMRALRTERNALMDKRADATKIFYAALSPEQKKTFDAETARRGHRGGYGHHQR
jgi:protein CpxP